VKLAAFTIRGRIADMPNARVITIEQLLDHDGDGIALSPGTEYEFRIDAFRVGKSAAAKEKNVPPS